MTVHALRVSARLVVKRVRKIATRDAGQIIIIPPPHRRSMAGMMNFRQVIVCLEKGTVDSTPIRNQHGDWEFTMRRHAGRLWTVVRVAVTCEGARVSRVHAIVEDPT